MQSAGPQAEADEPVSIEGPPPLARMAGVMALVDLFWNRVIVRVAPGLVTVSNLDAPVAAAAVRPGPQRVHGASRHGFELAIAQRISDRFDWPLELQTLSDRQNIARIHLAETLPVEVASHGKAHARR